MSDTAKPESTKGMPDDKDYEAKRAYKDAYAKIMKDFLQGHLKDEKGNEVKDKDAAHSMAEIEARKAVASLKKTGLKMSVFVD